MAKITDFYGEGITYIIRVPMEKQAVRNLKNLLSSQRSLICKALGIRSAEVEIVDGNAVFAWFNGEVDADDFQVYLRFISNLCTLSRRQTHISGEEKPLKDEKRSMRTLLLRMGYIGTEFKGDHRVLMRNLTSAAEQGDG